MNHFHMETMFVLLCSNTPLHSFRRAGHGETGSSKAIICMKYACFNPVLGLYELTLYCLQDFLTKISDDEWVLTEIESFIAPDIGFATRIIEYGKQRIKYVLKTPEVQKKDEKVLIKYEQLQFGIQIAIIFSLPG